MNRINQFNFEPGIYVCAAYIMVVVTELVTHHDDGTELQELPDPMVVFRSLEDKIEKYTRHSMRLSAFKSKYKRA